MSEDASSASMPAPAAAAALADYRLAVLSRHASVIGRREVLAGRASFGIFGDGKEVPQVALARAVEPGDWHAGYYRDQTLMLAARALTVRELFAQLYGDSNPARDPASAGRQMNAHFASRLLDGEGAPRSHLEGFNSWPGFGAVAVQMAAALGLAYASKLYRLSPEVAGAAAQFTDAGNEVVFAAIGNASAAEGIFFESVNAAAVLRVPLVVSVWDDSYGISVPNSAQMAMSSVSDALAGLGAGAGAGTQWNSPALEIVRVPGWDYPRLVEVYARAARAAREEHRPILVHVTDLTQPLGHSTSGSHERYKPATRLDWEKKNDCLLLMRRWLIETERASEPELDAIEAEARAEVERDAASAWADMAAEISGEVAEASTLLSALAAAVPDAALPTEIASDRPSRRAVQEQLFKALVATAGRESAARTAVAGHLRASKQAGLQRYRSHLYSDGPPSPLRVEPVAPQYPESPELVDGRQLLIRFWDQMLARDPRLFMIGEDVGNLGDVNLVFEGLQQKYGALRLTDTGIREATILGQGIGAALRGWRPLVDIQYLDYFLFALEIASDDLATMRYRTAGGLAAPVIVRTKGHRLVGMTHSGSPMSVILNACRGIRLCVPRNMTQAAGMYSTLLAGDDPAIVVEVLNAYRLKEPVPANLGEFKVALGVPEVLRPGSDLTVVTYGAMCRLALEAAEVLAGLGVEVEVIDVQTLNPFDVGARIRASVEKTGALLVTDEDVPGGASAFIVDRLMEEQDVFMLLDTAPRTLSGAENRPAYGPDGDYFTKPSVDDIVVAAYRIMRERAPRRFPELGI